VGERATQRKAAATGAAIIVKFDRIGVGEIHPTVGREGRAAGSGAFEKNTSGIAGECGERAAARRAAGQGYERRRTFKNHLGAAGNAGNAAAGKLHQRLALEQIERTRERARRRTGNVEDRLLGRAAVKIDPPAASQSRGREGGSRGESAIADL